MHLRQLTGGLNSVELIPLHQANQSQLVAMRGLGLVALDHVSRVRKRRATIRAQHPARMVVVEVADHHEINRGRVLAECFQGGDRVAAFDALDVAIARRHVQPGPGLHHDPLAAGLDRAAGSGHREFDRDHRSRRSGTTGPWEPPRRSCRRPDGTSPARTTRTRTLPPKMRACSTGVMA